LCDIWIIDHGTVLRSGNEVGHDRFHLVGCHIRTYERFYELIKATFIY